MLAKERGTWNREEFMKSWSLFPSLAVLIAAACSGSVSDSDGDSDGGTRSPSSPSGGGRASEAGLPASAGGGSHAGGGAQGGGSSNGGSAGTAAGGADSTDSAAGADSRDTGGGGTTREDGATGGSLGDGDTPDAHTHDADAPDAPPVARPRHLVFADNMACCAVFGYDTAARQKEVRAAQEGGIDGFAIDVFDRQGADEIFQAAEGTNPPFQLMWEFDGPTDAASMIGNIKKYASHPNQTRVDGKLLLSTWAGQDSNFGFASPTEGWKKGVLDPLQTAGISVFFLPMFFTPMDHVFPAGQADVQALLDDFPYVSGFSAESWFSGIAGLAPLAQSDRDYLAVLRPKNLAYMAAVAPLATAHKTGENYNFGDPGGARVMQERWKQVISADPDFVLLPTWNDPDEKSYIGPVGSAFPQNLPYSHDAWRELEKHYIAWYKTGVEPLITSDKLFYFYRGHSKNAVASNDPLGKPDNVDVLQDNLYVTAMLTTAGTVQLITGGQVTSFEVPAGISNLDVPFREGRQEVKLVRQGVAVIDSVGALQVSNQIERYEFNWTSDFAPKP